MSRWRESVRERVERMTPSQRAALRDAFRGGGPASPQLVAHVQRWGPGVEHDELLAFLRERLPDYMVPARIRFVEALPRTAAGKLDRRALARAAADDVGPPGPVESVAAGTPRNDAERVLAEIWKDVLDTDRIGVHDDFFELGGDSISSIRVISRAKKAGLIIDSSDFFASPTIAQLVRVAKRASDAG